ncbi:MAG: cobalamin B12-binding domain-containing protein, partial [Methanomassiliicoccales archaeon]|nr:cobalamin B12-binding domain-containing protein [Methanomassiliicoccales archaeon]
MLPRVALVNVGFEPDEPNVNPSPPLGAMCVGAYLRRYSVEVRLFDWSGYALEEARRKELEEYDPDIVGFTVLLSSSILRAMEVSRWSKELGATV